MAKVDYWMAETSQQTPVYSVAMGKEMTMKIYLWSLLAAMITNLTVSCTETKASPTPGVMIAPWDKIGDLLSVAQEEK